MITRSVDAADAASRANRGVGLQAGPKIEAFWFGSQVAVGGGLHGGRRRRFDNASCDNKPRERHNCPDDKQPEPPPSGRGRRQV